HIKLIYNKLYIIQSNSLLFILKYLKYEIFILENKQNNANGKKFSSVFTYSIIITAIVVLLGAIFPTQFNEIGTNLTGWITEYFGGSYMVIVLLMVFFCVFFIFFLIVYFTFRTDLDASAFTNTTLF